MVRYFAAVLLMGTAALAATTPSVTYDKDVLPILQKNCQSCHRPGEIGPMPLLTYQSTRPWAKADQGRGADEENAALVRRSRYGHFANDRRLSEADDQDPGAWVDAGAPEGDAKDSRLPCNGARAGTSSRTS